MKKIFIALFALITFIFSGESDVSSLSVDEMKIQELEELFDSQITTLKNRGVPKPIMGFLEDQKIAVLKKVIKMAIGDGNIPFLPIINQPYRSPYDLMTMVINGGKVGNSYLNPAMISNIVEIPNKPYYIYDVEDGSITRGKSPENAENIFKSQKRSPLTADEVMALATHTNVLSKHYVFAPGSRYISADKTPLLYLDRGIRPELGWGNVDESYDFRGSASCGSR